jgi:hypothetical protein
LLAGAAEAAPGDKTDIVRDLAGRVGPMVGSALACRDIARPPIQVIVDKFTAVITQFSYGDAGFAGVAKAFRALGINDGGILRLNCQRNTVDVDDVVTQVVPAVSGYSSLVLDYKNSLAKYFPGEAADYVSLEGFISANILIEAIKRTGPQLDTEKLIDVLENMRNLDLGLGVPLNFGRAEHQASHTIWGTAIDETGKYQAIELE